MILPSVHIFIYDLVEKDNICVTGFEIITSKGNDSLKQNIINSIIDVDLTNISVDIQHPLVYKLRKRLSGYRFT